MDLGGSAENQGDLKSVVLHKMTLGAHKSTFPIALGVRMTGVDDSCYSQTGESYSMIAMPNADTHMPRTLQEDNTELAYEFARKFPVSPDPLASYFFQCTLIYSLFNATLSPGWLRSYVALTFLRASAFCLSTFFSSSLNPMASHFASRF